MKNIFTLFIFCMFSIVIEAQNPVLNKYTFGEGLRFSGNDKYSIRLSGYFQPYIEVKTYNESEGSKTYLFASLRRARVRLSGDAAKQKIEYRLQIDFTGLSEAGDAITTPLLDGWIAYSPTKSIQIIVGQKATPTDNRELLMASQTLQLVERSRLTSAFSTIREFGIFVNGKFKTGGKTYLKPYFALTNGDGLNVFGKDRGGLKVGGRIDFLPFGLFSNLGQFRQADVVRENTPKLVFGGYYSMNFGMSSRRGRASGAIIYLTEGLEESLPNYSKYGADFLFKYKGFSVLGEFIASSATVPDDIFFRVRNDGSTSSSFLVDGSQNIDGYVKGRMMLGTALNIQMGYVFKNRISVDARYTHLRPALNSFLNNPTFYNRPNHYTLGLSKYFGKGYAFKIQSDVTYSQNSIGSNNFNGEPIIGDEWMVRFITTIAF